MSPVLGIILGGLVLGVAISIAKGSMSNANQKSIVLNGREWIVEVLGTSGTTASYLVKAPAGSFGPHIEFPVLQFSQVGTDVSSRTLTAKFPDVPVGVFDAAKTDFGIKVTF